MQDIAPTRSRTDPTAEPQHRDRRNLPKRLLAGSGKDHSYRQAAKDVVQSAIDLKPPISFDHLLGRDKKSSDPSKSRHHAQHNNPAQQSTVAETAPTFLEEHKERKRNVTAYEIEQARHENALRDSELRKTLKEVEEFAMRSTRQLDETYYTILDRVSILSALVSNLQRLTEESRLLHQTFHDDTTALERETTETLDTFGNFDAQKETIDQLVAKLEASQTETSELNSRLENARLRVEKYEQRERDKSKTSTTRWRVGYVLFSVIVVLVIAVMVVRRRSTIGTRMHTVAKVIDDFGGELAAPVVGLLRPKTRGEEDPYLRKLFDEL